jgi:ubiquinone/menaquinone biosynthesis C-methylase UbiE
MAFPRLLLTALLLLLLSCNKGDRWSEEWEERFEPIQPTARIMDTLGIRPGMVVAEIGAGNGRFAVRVAARVGDAGRVYANDIDPEALEFMRNRCSRENLQNITVVKGSLTDPMLPPARMDLIYVINSYEHFDDPVTILENAAPALKPGGILAIIATDPNKAPDARGHSVPLEVVLRDASIAGFEILRMATFLPRDNIYIFRIRGEIA